MGQQVDKDRYSEAEFTRFGERLTQQLTELRELLARPGFGAGPATIGAELEMFLITPDGRPLPRNHEVRDAADDDRLVPELGRFNLEVNLTPLPIAGRPFSALERELRETMTLVDTATATQGGQAVAIGILPSLSEFDFTHEALSDESRYRAMSRGLRRLRTEPFRVHIEGVEQLELEVEGVILESANTSWQVHLRTAPADFARVYNAAQLAIGPVLAVSGNSPSFLGRRLWEETRIALFEEAADDRDVERLDRRDRRVAFGSKWVSGIEEMFETCVRDYEPIMPMITEVVSPADGEAPELAELRLHQGTVWQWNRPIYDPANGGHLRVEMRALPAGPTPADMAANAAFLLGLTAAMAVEPVEEFPFAAAYRNFYRAAIHGLDASLSWPGRGTEEIPASRLALDLLPAARAGLIRLDVDPDEADRALGIIRDRVMLRRTGAIWQRETLERLGDDPAGRSRMVTRYRELSLTGKPVHTWPI
ncbi:glutamate--cysteine ligase [Streptosporangium sp. NBC_01756]|uniref:glutamate--cysteine ligase n=1 Tax=Streptosporangium sp. NBC_01756 TaxID=2975950 RepID=UPI002DDB4B7E|nr:glutamate--cysteine ligase [Streptosporangium sp. NBC_01756]WSC87420.1 glutamate--cysteine ligase [Streptosporangium sp. NBC_01756]